MLTPELGTGVGDRTGLSAPVEMMGLWFSKVPETHLQCLLKIRNSNSTPKSSDFIRSGMGAPGINSFETLLAYTSFVLLGTVRDHPIFAFLGCSMGYMHSWCSLNSSNMGR